MQDSELTQQINIAGSSGVPVYGPTFADFVSVVSGVPAGYCPYAVKDGTLLGEFKNGGGSNAPFTVYCRWEDRGVLATWFLAANNQAVGGYTIYLGAGHPLYANLYCDEVKIVPVEPPLEPYSYKYAMLEISCIERSWGGNGTLVRKEAVNPSGIQLSIPNFNNSSSGSTTGSGTFTGFTVGGQPINQSLSQPPTQSVYIPYIRYNVTVYNVTVLPLATIMSLTNTLNEAALTIHLGGGNTASVARGLALYEGITETEETVAYDGTQRWNITHQWLIGPIDQNMVPNWDLFNGDITNFLTTVFVMPDQKQYVYADHSQLGV